VRSYKPEWLDRYGIVEVGAKHICVLCNWNVPYESRKPNKLERHLKTKHNAVFKLSSEKRQTALRKAAEKLLGQQKLVRKALTLDEKVSVASFKLAFLVARKSRPYTEAESVSVFLYSMHRSAETSIN